jgi:hypothetical protein
MRAAKTHNRFQVIAHIGTFETLYKVRVERGLIFVT